MTHPQEAGKSKEQEEAEKRYPCPPSGFSYNKSKQLAFIAGTEYAQQREQPWVRVETALPDIAENVIVYTAYTDKGYPKNDMFCGYMDEYGELFYVSGDADESYGWQFNDCVTHWKPLPPAPPKQ